MSPTFRMERHEPGKSESESMTENEEHNNNKHEYPSSTKMRK
jgi:hypothetical protein